MLRAMYTGDKCEQIIGDRSQVMAAFKAGLMDRVGEEELAILMAAYLTQCYDGLTSAAYVKEVH